MRFKCHINLNYCHLIKSNIDLAYGQAYGDMHLEAERGSQDLNSSCSPRTKDRTKSSFLPQARATASPCGVIVRSRKTHLFLFPHHGTRPREQTQAGSQHLLTPWARYVCARNNLHGSLWGLSSRLLYILFHLLKTFVPIFTVLFLFHPSDLGLNAISSEQKYFSFILINLYLKILLFS